MADERKTDATRKVPPDKAAKNAPTRQTDATNTADAKKVKKDELIDDRFQATDN